MSIRTEKVSHEIKKTLAQSVSDIANSLNAGLATLTTVRISSDLKYAKVYVSLYGNTKYTVADLIDELNKKRGQLRHLLGSKVRLRFTPELSFFPDETLDEMERIQKLIDSNKPKEDTQE